MKIGRYDYDSLRELAHTKVSTRRCGYDFSFTFKDLGMWALGIPVGVDTESQFGKNRKNTLKQLQKKAKSLGISIYVKSGPRKGKTLKKSGLQAIITRHTNKSH
jgi:hypothetical protein